MTKVDEVRGAECVRVSSLSGGGLLAASLVFAVVLLSTPTLTALVSLAKLSRSLEMLHSTGRTFVEVLFVLPRTLVSLEDEEVNVSSAILLHR